MHAQGIDSKVTTEGADVLGRFKLLLEPEAVSRKRSGRCLEAEAVEEVDVLPACHTLTVTYPVLTGGAA